MDFKKLIKENLVLVIGLSLPLLLIILFFAATVIPKPIGTPPQYEILFTTVKYDNQYPSDYIVSYAVKDKHLVIKTKKHEDKLNNYNAKTILMAYDAKSETVREINVDTSKFPQTASEMVLEETKHYEVDSSVLSPDGYKLEMPRYGDRGLMGGLFGMGSGYASHRIIKDSIGYKLPEPKHGYYYNQVDFIGWVIKK